MLAMERDGPFQGSQTRPRLLRALREERRRARAGDPSYDLDRHLALLQAARGLNGRSAPDGRK
jgi:hypothetical protein